MPYSGWPAWWQWELSLSRHLLERMEHRGFTEIELRAIMEIASGLHPETNDRWAIESRWHGQNWEIIVEPDLEAEQLVVITAYPVDKD